METERYEITPIGWVRSSLTERTNAPRQGREGAPAADAQPFAQDPASADQRPRPERASEL